MKIVSNGVYVVLTLACLLLQGTFLSGINQSGLMPDLSFLVLIYFAFMTGSLEGVAAGFLYGLFMDVLTSVPFGFHSLCFTVLGYIAGKFKGTIQLDLILMPLLLIFVALVTRWIFMIIEALVLGTDALFLQLLQWPMLMQALVSLGVTPLVFLGLQALWKSLHRTQGFS